WHSIDLRAEHCEISSARFTKHLETLRLGPGMLHCDPADPVSHRDGSATLESATALGSCHPSRLWDSSFVCRSVRLQRGSHADSQRRHRCCLLRPIGLLSLFVEVRPAPSPNSKLCMQDSWSLASLWCTATSLTLAWSARVAWSRSAFLFLSAPRIPGVFSRFFQRGTSSFHSEGA